MKSAYSLLTLSAVVFSVAACTPAGSHPSADSAPATSTPATSTPAPSAALAALARLPVKGRAPQTGYTRDQFGAAWSDAVSVEGGHNGCDTRNDVLRRDLTAVTLKAGASGCTVLTGTLQDPYTGRSIPFTRGASTSAAIQIDHIVALSDAWQTGAQQLTADQRRDLANDPLNLWAVDGPSNQSKSDSDAASWLPPNKTTRCLYVSRQIAVKLTYRLWVTAAEGQALADVLSSCPTQTLATPAEWNTPAA